MQVQLYAPYLSKGEEWRLKLARGERVFLALFNFKLNKKSGSEPLLATTYSSAVWEIPPEQVRACYVWRTSRQ